jgi:predicted nuclease with TOPRIM domain
MPPSLEERVAYLEGKVEEHSRGFGEIRELLVHLNGRVEALDRKVNRFRHELASRIEAMDNRLSVRLDVLDQKLSRQFNWLVGMQVAILLSIIGALVSR